MTIKTMTVANINGHIRDQSSHHILVVDDNALNRDLLCRRMQRLGYSTDTAKNGIEALAQLTERSFDLVLLDIMMPEMNGYDVLKHMNADALLKHVPVIVISAKDEVDSITRCIEAGAEDYLPKPFNSALLKARIGSCLEKKRLHDLEQAHAAYLENFNAKLNEQIKQQVQLLTTAQLAAIFAMSKLAESKDNETGAHLERMREYCKILTEELSRLDIYRQTIDDDYIDNIYTASPLHDIGKVGIPDRILLKPGKLDTDEFGVMMSHAIIGAETLRAVDEQHPGNAFIKTGIDIAGCHHEKWDGSGYPLGLSGTEIPLSARILALADVFDALTSRRCYKEAFSIEKTEEIILEGRGKHFDPDVVEAFLNRRDDFIRIRQAFRDHDKVN